MAERYEQLADDLDARTGIKDAAEQGYDHV
jgi:hypothetical protein